ncbi:TniQ family protein [Desulfosporosinus sp. SB140]|uniref:TniQ family protein n=1 Tax=Desulfosporosinus paludis TaxID=3115649 RepID=UPI00388D6C7D
MKIKEKEYSRLVSKDVSRLYSLKPVAIFSSLSESLPSYIMRLAMAHRVTVGTLVQYEIIPRLKLNLIGGRSNFYTGVRRLYSASMLSRELIQVLEELTGNNDLISLNFNIGDRFGNSRIFRNFRAWCPHCLEQFRSEGGIIYEPLIWNFSIVEFCKKHRYPLQTKCPDCGQEMHLLTPSSIPGYCSRCRCWLGNTNSYPKNLNIEKGQWHWWVYDNIAELISESPKILQISDKYLITNNLKRIMNHYSGNGLRKFAQIVDLKRSTLYKWITRDVRPNLNLLLGLGYCIGLTIKQIATDQLLLDSTEITLLRQPVKKRSYINRAIDRELCEHSLNSAILDSFTPSINEIARQVSIDQRTLRYHFPEKVRDIAAKRRELSRRKSQLKELEVQEEIERTVIRIYHKGKYPNRNAVCGEMGNGWLFRKKSNYAAWEKAVLSLGLKLDF